MKTKRFLFFTGGTDSVLILHYLLLLMSKNKKDELVIVMVANSSMKSGKEGAIQEAVKHFVGNIVEKRLHCNKSIVDRISILLVNQSIESGDGSPIGFQGVTNDNIEFNFGIKLAEHDREFVKIIGSLVCQEIIILSSVPSIIPYLGSCKNTFYLGSCGSDVATRSTHQLRELFNLYFKIANMTSDSNSLEKELVKSGFKSYGRFEAKFINPDWIPTLEFPLQDLRKQDVVMLLDYEKLTSFEVAKPENLIEHFAADKGSEMYLMTKVYHYFKMSYGHPDDYPSLIDFIRTGSLRFKINDEETFISENQISEKIQEESINLIRRAFRI